METETKHCPHCGEEILAVAKKCKHCHERLEDSPDPTTPSDGTIPLSDRTLPLPEIKQILGGRYELLEELGRGGMGVVYRAHDIKLDTDVAVKLLPEHLASDKRGVEFLKREALASMKLSHPNILRLHHFEDHAEGKFLIMEFVKGGNLQQIQTGSPGSKLPEKQVVKYAIEACKGLEYAHSRGVIHRDIKPSNIMVDADGCVKIADFGIARVVKDSETHVTGTVTSGTLLYMSPEQLRGEKNDGRSDIYSLGISLYELLSGDVPFRSGDITYQHLAVTPSPIDGVSDRLNEILSKCLRKKPEDRYRNVGELLEELGGIAQQHTTDPVGRERVEETTVRPPFPSKPPLSALVALAAIIVAVMLGYLVYQRYISAPPKPVEQTEEEKIASLSELETPPEEDFNKYSGESTDISGEPALEKADVKEPPEATPEPAKKKVAKVDTQPSDSQDSGTGIDAVTEEQSKKEQSSQVPHEPPPVIVEEPEEKIVARVGCREILARLQKANPSFKVRVWTDKENYNIGDEIRYYFTAEENCYLTLLNVGTSGCMFMLFPNRHDKDNRINAGQIYEIPASQYGFDVVASGPAGTEYIKAVATKAPSALFDINVTNDFFLTIEESDARTTEISQAIERVCKGEWAEAEARFEIHP